jgi:GWxTD domain-containing protein
MPEKDRTFLKITNYIITKEEKRRYVVLPVEERSEFREKFWEKRDPDPGTEVNEFKEEYFKRIDFANNNFRESKEGWLTDRGRVFILLGPPSYTAYRIGRIPSAGNTNSRRYFYHPHFVWYYGNFPVIFVDYNNTNSYELEGLSNRHLASINMAMKDWQPRVNNEKLYFDFKARIKLKDSQKQLMIAIPYTGILFSSIGGNDMYVANFYIEVKIITKADKVVQELHKDCRIEMSKADSSRTELNYKQYFKLALDPGEYNAAIVIFNNQDGYKISKNIKFKF